MHPTTRAGTSLRFVQLLPKLPFTRPAFSSAPDPPKAKTRNRLRSALPCFAELPCIPALAFSRPVINNFTGSLGIFPVPRPIPLTGFDAPSTRSPTHGKRSLVLPLHGKTPLSTARKEPSFRCTSVLHFPGARPQIRLYRF